MKIHLLSLLWFVASLVHSLDGRYTTDISLGFHHEDSIGTTLRTPIDVSSSSTPTASPTRQSNPISSRDFQRRNDGYLLRSRRTTRRQHDIDTTRTATPSSSSEPFTRTAKASHQQQSSTPTHRPTRFVSEESSTTSSSFPATNKSPASQSLLKHLRKRGSTPKPVLMTSSPVTNLFRTLEVKYDREVAAEQSAIETDKDILIQEVLHLLDDLPTESPSTQQSTPQADDSDSSRQHDNDDVNAGNGASDKTPNDDNDNRGHTGRDDKNNNGNNKLNDFTTERIDTHTSFDDVTSSHQPLYNDQDVQRAPGAKPLVIIIYYRSTRLRLNITRLRNFTRDQLIALVKKLQELIRQIRQQNNYQIKLELAKLCCFL